MFKNLLALFFLVMSVSTFADFDSGIAAYDKADFKTALNEFKPPAEQGDAIAQFNLGLMYDEGKGVPQDYKVAASWLAKAAEQGLSEAQYNLGLKYDEGKGVPQNYKVAASWYLKAAEQGLSSAQTNLGVMYAKGQGVPRDYKLSYALLNLSGANKQRDAVLKQMTQLQIIESQDLTRELAKPNNFKKALSAYLNGKK